MAADAVVFDLDGTLWDTCATCAIAWNDALARLGIPYRSVTAADVRAVSGRPHPDAIRRAFPDLSDADAQRVADATAVADNEAIARLGGDLYPGVVDVVPALARRVPLMIVSNCQRGYVETFLSFTGLGPHFADFECWGNTGETKAANLRAIVARNGLRAAVFVGDTEGDREAAEANGVAFVHVAWGFGHVARCDHRVERFADLPSLLDGRR